MMSNLIDLNMNCDPQLIMVIGPETKYRFRYRSEKGSHGAITGKIKQNSRKTYPTVQLINYHESKNVFIRVRLYTETQTEHVLQFKRKKSEEGQNYVDEDLKTDNTATFKNLTILSKKKDEIYHALMDRKIKNLGRNISKPARERIEEKSSEDVKKAAKNILNSVILRFDAFDKDRPNDPLCPPLYSEPICNQKAASKGDLRIHRMSKVAGTWKGGDEIILLCDKVQKDNIKILFFETDENDCRIWESYGSFTQADVHYQVAITFKTPPYENNVEKTVSVCLDRQGELSDPREFTYIADYDDNPSKKRKKCVSEQAMQLLSVGEITSSMNFSPLDSSNTGTSYDSTPEISTPQPNESNSNSMQERSISPLPFDMEDQDEELAEILRQLNEGYRLPNESVIGSPENMYTQISFDMIQPEFFLCEDQVKMDVGKLVPQMGAVSITEVDGQSPISFAQRFMSRTSRMECESDKSSKKFLQTDKQSKYSHFMVKRNISGNTLLHLAVLSNKNVGAVLHMNQITNYDIVNVQNNNKQTALHIATEKNNVCLVQVLLHNGGNPNVKNAEGNNCYHIASKNSFAKCMNALLTYKEFNADVNEFNYEGLTPLHIAIMKNSEDCFNLLKMYRANIKVFERKGGRSLLHYAVEFQPSLVTPLLEEEEIDINIQDFEGNTPLHVACVIENFDTVKQLLLAGADPLVRNFKQSSHNLEEGDEDEEATIGQSPSDVTTNLEILQILRQATEKDKSALDHSKEFSGSEEVSDVITEKLCNLLDPDMRWKTVAMYFMDENLFDSLKCSESPTKALLRYIKRNLGEGYIEEFKHALEMAELHDAVQIVKESKDP